MSFRSVHVCIFRFQINEGFLLQLTELFIISSRAYFVQCGCFEKKKRKRENREEISKLAFTKPYFAPKLLYNMGRQNQHGEGGESFDHFVL